MAEVKKVTKKAVEAKETKDVKKATPKKKKVYHLKKVDGKWEVILKEGEKVIKKFDTKEEAMAYCEVLVKNQDGTLLVHASKGKSKGRFIKS